MGGDRLPLFGEQVGWCALVASVALLAVSGVGVAVGNDVVIGLPLGFGIVGMIVVLVAPAGHPENAAHLGRHGGRRSFRALDL